jgi:hypothetical protein
VQLFVDQPISKKFWSLDTDMFQPHDGRDETGLELTAIVVPHGSAQVADRSRQTDQSLQLMIPCWMGTLRLSGWSPDDRSLPKLLKKPIYQTSDTILVWVE